ncbi:hypothetical protein EGT74_13455 [Chitinophaga lutea]|uniref:BIG2 domain-containing protein n=1 Tax=Chitinophaga lutea TaxID=2488634 RepID=A0A3N4PH92_9BACT|nr:hypothetical protein [Chitinophaga lutea]RPE08072.1 hypothetical protein EGT74_13455 [Chitinophaga lutea]
MRLFHVLIFLVPCLTLLSCKKDQEAAKIPVNTSTVQLLAGQQTEIVITGEVKPYTVASDHPDIAGATVQDNKITVTTNKSGITYIRLSDGTLTASIKVIATTLAGRNWVRITGDANYETKVTVEGTDASFAATLKKQLEDELALPRNTLLGVTYNDAPPAFREEYADRSRREGAYSYDKLVATQVYNGVTEVYRLIAMTKTIFAFERDLTTHYKSLHADKGLQKVTVTRFLRDRPFPG